MNTTYLLLGSNMGNSQQQLAKAAALIAEHAGTIQQCSPLYVTAAWGNTDQPDFLNQVLVIETVFTARETLEHVLAIEKKMGRVRTVKNAPRIIDIDILFFNDAIIREKDLVVPHPEIQNRRFVLTPLNELDPGYLHPVLKKTVQELLLECKDPLPVKKF